MKTLVYSLVIFASFFSVAEQMAKISKNGSVFIVPNRDGNDPLEGKQYTLLYGGKQYCGTVS